MNKFGDKLSLGISSSSSSLIFKAHFIIRLLDVFIKLFIGAKASIFYQKIMMKSFINFLINPFIV